MRSWDILKYFNTTTYHGQPLPLSARLVPEGRMEELEAYEDFRNNDIIVSSFPKAGTHWVMDIVSKLQLNGDLEAANRVPRPYLTIVPSPWHEGGHEVAGTLADISRMQSPRVIATHLWYENLPALIKQKNIKIIYVWRDWKDSVLSHYDMLKSDLVPAVVPDWDAAFEMLTSEVVPMGLWPDSIRSYQKQIGNPNMMFLRYEDMRQDLMPSVRKIATFIGASNVSEETIIKIGESCTFEAAQKSSADGGMYVNKGIVGRWKQHFSPAQSEKIDRILEREGLSDVKFE